MARNSEALDKKKMKRIFSNATRIAKTMKTGKIKTVPKTRINGGKVMIERGNGDDFKVYYATNKKYDNGKTYAIGVGFGNTGVYFHYTNQYSRWKNRLYTVGGRKHTYKAGKTGSYGG